MEESDFTTGGFSTLEVIPKRRAMIEMEGCTNFCQVMVWFEFHQ